MRYFLECGYLGTKYHGWQIQPNGRSIEQTLEETLTLLVGQPIDIVGSSRTDTGVHARQQFAHFDLELNRSIDWTQLVYKANHILPTDVVIYRIFPVDSEAHSRFDALGRKYIYRLNRTKNPFLEPMVWDYRFDLNVDLMNQAAAFLLQHTDYQCFSKVNTSVSTFNCTITQAEWFEVANVWEFHIQANRFLRGMVRAIVGTLLEVGRRRISLEQFQEILNSRDRTRAGQNVAAVGLTLEKVIYPENYFSDEGTD